MRVIIWGINFAPEPTGIAPYTTELAAHLQRRGLGVEVVTGFAYYPAWTKRPGDARKLFRSEKIGDVTVHRCWQFVPRKLGTLKRVFHELSFGITSLVRTLALPRADVYVVISPPLGLGVVAWVVSRLKRSRYLFHVQDLQPDSAAGLGMVRPGVFLRLMYACERLAYRKAAAVSGISSGMIDAFGAKGVPSDRIFLLPNWLRQPGQVAPQPDEVARFRQTHAIPPGAFLAVYSGNLGRKQGLEMLVDAAGILARIFHTQNENGPHSVYWSRSAPAAVDARTTARAPWLQEISGLAARSAGERPVVLIIAGDGADQVLLARRLARQPLANLRLLPLQSATAYRAMLQSADVALVTQMPGTGQVCFPSKLLSVLSAGLPVITAADATSDLARAVGEGGFGRNVPAADPAAMAAALREAAGDPALVARWQRNTSWVNRFSPEAILARFETAVRALGTGDAVAPPALDHLPRSVN